MQRSEKQQGQTSSDTLNQKHANAQVTRALLGIGSNLGDRGAHLNRALEMLMLTAQVSVVAVSEIYETAPMYNIEQPAFWNGGVMVETTLSAPRLLAVLLAVETLCGRVRLEANGPRTLDLDIVFYGQHIIDERDVQVPHPRFAERPFVLVPLMDLDDQWEDARSGKPLRAILDALLAMRATVSTSSRDRWPEQLSGIWSPGLLAQLTQEARPNVP